MHLMGVEGGRDDLIKFVIYRIIIMKKEIDSRKEKGSEKRRRKEKRQVDRKSLSME